MLLNHFFQTIKFDIIFELLGDPTGAPPLDPAGGLPSPRPPDLAPQTKFPRAAYVSAINEEVCQY